jgi:hypothetical protein
MKKHLELIEEICINECDTQKAVEEIYMIVHVLNWECKHKDWEEQIKKKILWEKTE